MAQYFFMASQVSSKATEANFFHLKLTTKVQFLKSTKLMNEAELSAGWVLHLSVTSISTAAAQSGAPPAHSKLR